MQKLIAVWLICFCAVSALAAAPQPVVIVVDTNRIMREAQAAVDIARQVEDLGARYANEFNAAEARLRQEDQALTKQRDLLSKEAYKAKVKELRDRLMALRGSAQRQRTLLDRARVEAVRKVQLQLHEVARALAGEVGANIVIQKAALVWADEEALELTDDVLTRLNEVLPGVTIEVSE
ncbi:MAG: OmpH family outer membrane protein [Alphaproteobacteria bacterium]|nr:OmpH family outer membrane protein [Alphaproteobacteria bacterium]MCY4320634.1 OmpH family outer membrane protein [Alphaproteobacteria bacterium]